MTEANEPSYYEVALTNRQVLVSFVVLLGCILVAFVFGVWVGKEGSDPAIEDMAAGPGEQQEMAKLEELQFFNEESDTAPEDLDKPDLSSLFDGPEGTTLAQDVGSARGSDADGTTARESGPQETAVQETAVQETAAQQTPSQRSTPPPPTAPPPTTPPPTAPPRSTPPKAPAAQTPAAASPSKAAAPAEGFIVQVFSSHDRVQAQKVLDQMRQGGYRAFLSPLQRDGSRQVMYRVRLGPFDQRPPADAAAGDVTRQYKLETWVTAASN